MPLKANPLGEIPRLRPAPSLREGKTNTRGTSLGMTGSGEAGSFEMRSFEAHPGVDCCVDEIG